MVIYLAPGRLNSRGFITLVCVVWQRGLFVNNNACTYYGIDIRFIYQIAIITLNSVVIQYSVPIQHYEKYLRNIEVLCQKTQITSNGDRDVPAFWNDGKREFGLYSFRDFLAKLSWNIRRINMNPFWLIIQHSGKCVCYCMYKWFVDACKATSKTMIILVPYPL